MPRPPFDTWVVGDEIPSLVKDPMSPAHIVRWSAAMENWHRIHYDWRYATLHDRLPGVLVSGSWKQHVLILLMTDWVEEVGWLWTIAFQFRGMSVPGDTLTAWGRISGKEQRGSFGLVTLDIGLRNQDGVDGTPGTAVTVWPTRGGPPVPYPFDPRILAPAPKGSVI